MEAVVGSTTDLIGKHSRPSISWSSNAFYKVRGKMLGSCEVRKQAAGCLLTNFRVSLIG